MNSETARAGDPLEALQACHRQIEEQLAALERLGRSEGGARDDDLRPCHGSKFDLAGRVYRGSPAPTNLVIPPHQYLSQQTLRVGEDERA